MAEDLVNKCLHGKIQNANGLIRSRLPKTVFVGRGTIEVGVNSAIIPFNDGCNRVLKFLEHFGLKRKISKAVPINLDDLRIRQMEKSKDAEKKRRKGLRA